MIDQLLSTQSGKEQLINELLDALQAKFVLGIHRSASVGLTLTLYGGQFKHLTLADQSVTLVALTTSFVQANANTGVVTATSGVVTSIKITSGGTGYTSAPTVVFTPTAGGSGATATAVLTAGVVTSAIVTAGGTSYAFMPTISFTGGGGSGAVANATGYTIGAIELGSAISSGTGLATWLAVDRETWPLAT